MTIQQILVLYRTIFIFLGISLCILCHKQIGQWYQKLREYNALNNFLVLLSAGSVFSVFLVNLVMCFIIDGVPLLDAIFSSIETAFDVLSGNSEEFRGLGRDSILFCHLTIPLSFLTPIVAAGTIIQFLIQHRPRMMWFGKEYFVFSVLNQHSVALAKSLMKAHEQHTRCVFLRTSVDRADADAVSELRGMKCFLFNGTEADLLKQRRILRKKELRFFFVSDRTEENFSSAEAFIDAVKNDALFPAQEKHPFNNEVFRQELYILAETESSPLLIDNLRNKMMESGKRHAVFQNAELRLLDRYRSIVYGLLDRKPIHSNIGADEEATVMILGMGHIGTEFLRAAASLAVYPDKKCHFILCDKNIFENKQAIEQKYPELLSNLDIYTDANDIERTQITQLLDNHLKRAEISYIVVALGDDERNIHAALALMRYYRRKKWNQESCKVPVICVNLEDNLKSKYFETLLQNEQTQEFQFVVFGSDEETFSEKNLLPRNVWKAAREIHSKLSPPTFDVWTEYERRSSIACVYHAGCYLPSDGTDYGKYVEQNHEKLIQTEHNRWMQYVRSEGMQKATLAEVETYFGKLGRHVDIIGQLSPCLVDASELDDLHQKLKKYDSNLSSFRKKDKTVIDQAKALQEIIKTGKVPDELIEEG